MKVEEHKIKKTGEPLVLHLVETPDIVATLAASKRPEQWLVGFALETEDQRFRAVTKMQKKSCDLMVLNGPQAISSAENVVEVLDKTGDRILEPEDGVVEGRLAVLDLTMEGRWGGVISGDKVVLDLNPTPDGIVTPKVRNVARYAELEEGEDKLTCAGTIETYVRGTIAAE
jgi:citrate lyase beta subunit